MTSRLGGCGFGFDLCGLDGRALVTHWLVLVGFGLVGFGCFSLILDGSGWFWLVIFLVLVGSCRFLSVLAGSGSRAV